MIQLRYLVFLLVCFITNYLSAQNVSLGWAKNFSGNNQDKGTYIVLDTAGNVYTIGNFRGTCDFDPGPGVFNLTAAALDEAFISKINKHGSFVWAKQLGGIVDQSALLAYDTTGYLYVAGSFTGTADFDPTPSTFTMTAAASASDIFITKLDLAGNFIWAKEIQGTSYNGCFGITLDQFGNLYATGYLTGSTDFDPGPGSFQLSAPGTSGTSHLYILKLTSAGSFVWAKKIGTAGSGSGNHSGKTILIDHSGNVCITGTFESVNCDFDPNGGIFTMSSAGNSDLFILKLTPLGDFVWAKRIGGNTFDFISTSAVDGDNNIYLGGYFQGVIDFDPGPGIYNLQANANDFFICKLNSSGNFIWAKSIGGSYNDEIKCLITDKFNHVYATGGFALNAFGPGNIVDFDPGPASFNLISSGSSAGDLFVLKLSELGDFILAKKIGSINGEIGCALALDEYLNLYVTGSFGDMAGSTCDFDPGPGVLNLISAGFSDAFVLKLKQSYTTGHVYHDFNANCIINGNEPAIPGRSIIIQPGNIVAQTNSQGNWFTDSLSPGTYIIYPDTTGNWQRTCVSPQVFSIITSDSVNTAPHIGLFSTSPCALPDVSIFAPVLRPCMNQNIYVQACNDIAGTGVMNSAYIDIKLDSLLAIQSATIPFISQGNNTYRFSIGDLFPDDCINFTLNCMVNCSTVVGRTLCIDANLYPAPLCVFDTIPNPFPIGNVSPCGLPYDNSHLTVTGSCINNTIQFVIQNEAPLGIGDMTCYSPIRVFIDGNLISLDSLKLNGGDSIVYTFSGDGRTWRIEANQHPEHPGNSQPNITVESCGNPINWTPNLVNILPADDADPIVDIFCGLVTASYDPNDKTGYPLGLTDSHYVSKNTQMQYVIRFQNTGTDTAFTIVVQDTLDTDLNIFSVSPGVASHSYEFAMFGPRVLQWTFNNIHLPDSTTNEEGSHGFLTFSVNQNPNLASGTLIKNSADIYFDFNAPVITNKTQHNIFEAIQQPVSWNFYDTINITSCDSVDFNGLVYNYSGLYFVPQVNEPGPDTLITLNLTISPLLLQVIQSGSSLTALSSGASYQWVNCSNGYTQVLGATAQNFTIPDLDNYAVIITQNGCTDTSACFNIVGIENTSFDSRLKLSPNPTRDGLVTIDLGMMPTDNIQVEVLNTLGEIISHTLISTRNFNLMLPEANGVYFIRLTTNTQRITVRIVNN